MSTDHGQSWEHLARRSMESQLQTKRTTFEDAITNLQDRLIEGEEITAEDINDVRNAIIETQYVIEKDLAPHVEGVDPNAKVTEVLTEGELAKQIAAGRGLNVTDQHVTEVILPKIQEAIEELWQECYEPSDIIDP